MPYRRLARVVCALAAVGSAAAGAQTLLDAKVEPAIVSTGRPVTLTANFSNADNPNCGVRVHWGDGRQMDLRINQAKDVPLVARHSYAKPGSYTVMVEPKTQGLSMKCVGANQRVAVTVTAPPPAAAAPAQAAAAPRGPACAAAWTLDAKSVNRKSGAYTCNARSGTAMPTPAPDCPGALTFFYNAKRGQYGCRP
jgi:hypothetical protein